jgi:hypothetical protein
MGCDGASAPLVGRSDASFGSTDPVVKKVGALASCSLLRAVFAQVGAVKNKSTQVTCPAGALVMSSSKSVPSPSITLLPPRAWVELAVRVIVMT